MFRLIISLFLFLSISLFSKAQTVSTDSSLTRSYFSESLGDFGAAITEMKSYQGNEYFLNLRKAWLYYNLKDYPNAVKHYFYADSLVSTSLETKLGLVNCYFGGKDYKRCEQMCLKILKADKSNRSALMTLSSLKIINLEYTAAGEYLNTVLKYYPCDFDALVALISLNREIGNPGKCRTYAQHLINLYPNSPTALELCKSLSSE